MADKIIEVSTETQKLNINAKKPQRKNFRWDTDMIEHLIDCLLDYKSSMTFKNLDFDADKPAQYKHLRVAMANIYEEDVSLFGPLAVTSLPDDFEQLSKEDKAKAKLLQKISKELIEKGNKRIIEKVKEIRQNFAKAVVAGRRSGSGKIMYEFYDKLVLIWGGSANTEPLPYGVTADDFLEENSDEDDINYDEIDKEIQQAEKNDRDDDSVQNCENGDGAMAGSSIVIPSKRKGNCVPQLIDNKRKHLERNLSAAQRDQLLIQEAKEDCKFKRDLTNVMRESSDKLAESVKVIGQSMTDLGTGISRSIEMLSVAIMQQQQQQQQANPLNQNVFYQQHEYPSHPIQPVSNDHPCSQMMNPQQVQQSKQQNDQSTGNYYFK